MSSSVEPKKVGSSHDGSEYGAKTTHLEIKTKLERILAENVTLTTDLTAKSEADEKLAKVKKLITDHVHTAADVLMNFCENYFATPKPTFQLTFGYMMAMEFCNQLEGWLVAFHIFDHDCIKNDELIYCTYELVLDDLSCFEFRSFGFDHTCAYRLKNMMAKYIWRVYEAEYWDEDWDDEEDEKDPVIRTMNALHDAIVFLCDQLVHYFKHRCYEKEVKPKAKPRGLDDDRFDDIISTGRFEIVCLGGKSEDESEDESRGRH